MLADIDVERECLERLEAEMFEVSEIGIRMQICRI